MLCDMVSDSDSVAVVEAECVTGCDADADAL